MPGCWHLLVSKINLGGKKTNLEILCIAPVSASQPRVYLKTDHKYEIVLQ